MTEKIIDPRLYEIQFDEEKINLFIVPSKGNKRTSEYIKNRLSNEFSISSSIDNITYNLYFGAIKNEIPSLIDFVEGCDYVKALEIDDFKQEDTELKEW